MVGKTVSHNRILEELCGLEALRRHRSQGFALRHPAAIEYGTVAMIATEKTQTRHS
jgi:hypothetical protein